MTQEDSCFGEQLPILAALETIAAKHAFRSRARSAVISGALAISVIEAYMAHCAREVRRKGRPRGTLGKSKYWEFQVGHRATGWNSEVGRLALTREKIQRDLVALAKIAECYALASSEFNALATAAFALVRLAADDRPLLRYHRVRSRMGEPLTARQRKHLQSLGVEV